MAQEVPLAPGEVYGLRFWHVSDTGHLLSVSQHVPPWTSGVNEAVCLVQVRDEPRAPEPPCEPVPPTRIHAEPAFDGTSLVTYESSGGARVMRLESGDAHSHPRRFPEMKAGPSVELTPYSHFDLELTAELDRLMHEQALRDYEIAQLMYPEQLKAYAKRCREYEQELEKFRAEIAEHVPPQKNCDCGFYLVADTKGYEHYANTAPSVLGVVKAWGRTQKYGQGWRVQKAQIVALCPWNFRVGEIQQYVRRTIWSGSWAGFGLISMGEDSYVDRVDTDRMAAIETNYPDAQMFGGPSSMRDAWDWRISA